MKYNTLKAENICKKYDQRVVVNNVNIEVNRGEGIKSLNGSLSSIIRLKQ